MKHEAFFTDVLEAVKRQSPVSFDKVVYIDDIISVFDAHSKKLPLSLQTHFFKPNFKKQN